MNCLFLYNPCSGKEKVAKRAFSVAARLRGKYETVDVRASTRPGEMSEIAKDACGRYDALLFAGGDGSFNEVLSGLAECDNRPLLGYIPTGTVNDIARSLGIPRRSIRKAVNVFLRGEATYLDVMKINDRYAQYEVSAGVFTSCSYRAPHEEKIRLGKFAYGLEMLRHNLKFDEFSVTVEANGERKTAVCEFVIFINSRSVASMPVNRNAQLADGEIELLLVKQAPGPRFRSRIGAVFNVALFFLFGYGSMKRRAVYERIKASEFKVGAPADLVWNFDGEEGVKGDLELSVLPRHLAIVVPRPKRRRGRRTERK